MDRRKMLTLGALGTLGLTLPELLQAEAARGGPSERSCIFIFPFGGPSQLDIFDMKPNAPADVRGEFHPAATSVPGIQIVEHLPRLAKLAHRYTLVRSVNHTATDHYAASHYVLTAGDPIAERHWPSTGSILSALRPSRPPLPSYVHLPRIVMDGGLHREAGGQKSGFLPKAHAPFVIAADLGSPEFSISKAFQTAQGIDPTRLAARRTLAQQLDSAAVSSPQFDAFHGRAFDLMTSRNTVKAFDIGAESGVVRDRYGRNEFGQSLLLARRLVEAGVRLVFVNDSNASTQVFRWDTHGPKSDGAPANFPKLRQNLPQLDAALASLLEDLQDRGLLETTLVVWMGEMGRTPKLNKEASRDHWPFCYTAFLAGGGIPGGAVYGTSDSQAAYPKDKPVHPADIHATIFQSLGLGQETTIQDSLNRPVHIYRGTPLAIR